MVESAQDVSPTSQFIQTTVCAFILSLPSQEAQPRSSRGGATSRLISLMIFQQNHAYFPLQPQTCSPETPNVPRHNQSLFRENHLSQD